MCHLRLATRQKRKRTWEAIHQASRFTMESEARQAHRVSASRMLDYFINESRELKNPKVIEIHVYAETARQAADR
jgi:hypothetical protein